MFWHVLKRSLSDKTNGRICIGLPCYAWSTLRILSAFAFFASIHCIDSPAWPQSRSTSYLSLAPPAITSIRLMKFHYLDGYHPWIFIYLVWTYLIVSCHLWLPSITCAFSYFLRIIIGWTQGAIEDAAFPLSTFFPFLVLKLCLVARFL